MACTRIHFLLTICVLQLVTIAERQVMDFLGEMWAPILINFFHIIFVIFGFFGAYQLSAKYIVTYSVWNFIFIGWNAFLVCFYLNVGVLDRESDLLNLGTGSYSWFLVNGYGCKATFSDNITIIDDPYRPRRPELVENCLLDYSWVEVIHSGVQCLLAVMGIVAALIVGRIFMEDDDRFQRSNLKNQSQKTSRHSLYSMESGTDTVRSRRSVRSSRGTIHDDDGEDVQHPDLSPKPMTPRRVKHRSSRRQSRNRSSRRKMQHQNPVTKLMNQQQTAISNQGYVGSAPNRYPHMTPSLTASNLKHLNQSADPIYYNMNASSPLLTASQSTTGLHHHQSQQQQPQSSVYPPSRYPGGVPPPVGHYNPTYQHSTPNLLTGNHHDMMDDLYNRPPSVRSSYSNFHGVRALNNLTAEPPVPQLPERDRSMAFLNSAPPAYNLNYHTPPDSQSETTM